MDEQLLHQLNELCRQLRPLELSALTLSHRAVGAALLLAFAGFLAWRLRPAWLVVLSLGATVGATDALCYYLLKPMVARPRPCHELADLFTPAGCGGPWSMPSNHAANAFAAAVLVTFVYPRAAPLTLTLAAAVGASRVFLGVHYPSDVVVGAFVGTAVGIIAGLLVWRRVSLRPRRRPLA